MTLLTSDNAKTSKGEKYGYHTAILYLSPSDYSGVNLCPMAKIAGCGLDNTCLFHAGRGRMSSTVAGRLRKTVFFNTDRIGFIKELIQDIKKEKRKSVINNTRLAIRLNGTSDIVWERIPVTDNGIEYNNIFELFNDIQFYDYTKIATRDTSIKNYDLTFSYSGTEKFKPFVEKALSNGMRTAVVFRTKNFPIIFMGKKVIAGDDSDLRFTEPQNVIVGLYAKGSAIKDKTGFVVDC